MARTKVLNLLLIVSSLIVYLEWGTDNRMFLIEGEMELFSKMFENPLSVIHPFTLLPLFGQVILLVTLFQKAPGKILTYLGMGGLSVLIVFIFFIGLISLNYKITLSTIPFLIVAALVIRNQRTISKLEN